MADNSWRRPRQADIARLAGVSQATVSYVVNGRTDGPAIPDQTRDRVLAAARELGYVANPSARSLAGGANRLIGVYTFESMFPMDHHDFYYPFLVGIEAEAEAQGYDLVLFTSATTADGRRSIFRGHTSRLGLADGCVLLGKNADRDELVQLRDDRYPFTYVGRREIPGGRISYVAADYAAATGRVVDHLVKLGHRRLAQLGPRTPGEYSADRDSGLREASARHGLDGTGLDCPIDDAGPGTDDVRRLLAAGATAFVVHEPAAALRVRAILGELGLRVPADCSLAVLNDPPGGIPEAADLTCFQIPRRGMGSRAVRLLLKQINDPRNAKPHTAVLRCTFVPGRTSGPAPAVSLKGMT
ncbi:LacI family transcriptional regulator [Micromonospora sp. M71_S20]|uniref:LacI family DNA-binding transcriptional regulator n=1 Tax=Micromonospora sp. M71_S20 TaxID=592872 RepID=UPI000EABAF00|nr:LacI family DNA-binding transcriptional regulator [Micromonospora sp. M71_S20]RLK09593.1 LacI family transcriptional regulator [Micromonospora sp. M71_S20]